MQSWMILPAICALVLVCTCTRAEVPKTEELQGGRWVTVNKPSTQVASDPELVAAEELIGRGRYTDAQDRLVRWFKANKGSPMFDRGLYLMAAALYRYGDRIRSFFYLDELLDEYPDSSLYAQAMEKQYLIADQYLKGYKRRFLGVPMLSADEEAIEMLFRIQTRAPGSVIADRALLRTADYYYDDREYDLAADAYAAYIRAYPRSPEIPRVKLRQAYSNMAQFRGLRFDATPYVDARAQLAEYMAQYPQVAEEERIADRIGQIDSAFASKLFVTADFYRRTNEPRAAVYLYRTVISAYPDSEDARKAQVALSSMPKWALDEPPPGKTILGLPTTAPANQ